MELLQNESNYVNYFAREGPVIWFDAKQRKAVNTEASIQLNNWHINYY
jgi:hypothetical protein